MSRCRLMAGDRTQCHRWQRRCWCSRRSRPGHVASVLTAVGHLEGVGIRVKTLDLLLCGAVEELLVGTPVVAPGSGAKRSHREDISKVETQKNSK